MVRLALLTGTLLACAAGLRADVTLAPLFRDGAVVQRDRPLPVWGRAASGEKIAVRFHGRTAETVATPEGAWRVTLAPLAASSRGEELVVVGTNTVRVKDVLVGDVWLCSGQSNMEFRVRQAQNAAEEIAAAEAPTIRHFKIPHTVAAQPAFDCAGAWTSCTPVTAGEFTAVGYFFAREWQRRAEVPVGLIDSTWGGTQIESWMSEHALRADPAADAIFERWRRRLADHPAAIAAYEEAAAKWEREVAAAKKEPRSRPGRRPAAPEGEGSRWQPAGLFHAMVAPLQTAALRGVLWYQGEANAARAGEYRTLFPGLIRQWRADFAQPDLPFYFVQLANFERRDDETGRAWAFLREAQTRALALPHTGMAVTIDIGDPKDIHPKNKQEVGHRLALVARRELLGDAVECSGPRLVRSEREGAGLRLTFTHATGLNSGSQPLVDFVVAGADRKFHPAGARIEGEAVVVSSPAVAEPVAARYAWSNAPEARLKNGAGLPAAPFRTDDWEE